MSAVSRAAAAAIALVAIGGVLAAHLPWIDDRFDAGFEAGNSGRFTGVILESWARVGFVELRGRPILRLLPTDPPDGRTYANHPPTVRWATWLVVRRWGIGETTIRVLPVACCALTAALLAAFMARRHGAVAGLAAAVGFATLPLTFLYGRMNNYEAPLTLVMVLTLLSGLRSRTRGRDAALAALTACAVAVDWAGGFLVPALVLQQLLLRRRPWSAAVAATAGAATATVAYLGLVAWWEGGLREALDIVLHAADSGAGGYDELTWGGFAADQVRFVGELFGVGGAVSLIVALAVAIGVSARGPSPTCAVMFGSTLIALLNVVIFRSHSFSHDFYWYYLQPAAVLSIGAVAGRLARRGGFGLAAAILVVTGTGALGVIETEERREREVRGRAVRLAAALDALGGEDTAIVVERPLGATAFHARAWIIDHPLDDARLVWMAGEVRAGAWRVRRLVVPDDPTAPMPAERRAALLAGGFSERNIGPARVFVAE